MKLVNPVFWPLLIGMIAVTACTGADVERATFYGLQDWQCNKETRETGTPSCVAHDQRYERYRDERDSALGE